MEEQKAINFLEALDSDWLKPERVKDDKHGFACVNFSQSTDTDGNFKVELDLESDGGKLKKKFTLNKTNLKFMKNAGVNNPIGKVFYFRKVIVPYKGDEVEALRIARIE